MTDAAPDTPPHCCCHVRQGELHALLLKELKECHLLCHPFFKSLAFLNIYLKEAFVDNCLEGVSPGYFMESQTDKILHGIETDDLVKVARQQLWYIMFRTKHYLSALNIRGKSSFSFFQ